MTHDASQVLFRLATLADMAPVTGASDQVRIERSRAGGPFVHVRGALVAEYLDPDGLPQYVVALSPRLAPGDQLRISCPQCYEWIHIEPTEVPVMV